MSSIETLSHSVVASLEITSEDPRWWPRPLDGEKDRADDYITTAILGHRVLESLAKCILTVLKLLHLFLQVVADTLDARERPLAGERRL